uniref:Gamma-glutamylcyclotransferase family protein n=1 Tax=Chromera velia CCMP2878 TaxID=1169474 RepID=A0A0G4HRR3_9ALVE|mmetsp:Transcript_22021/g.43710  ORF Transcript_22021/g.43710 Transcript_22021/m.43710 type:complete len:186 (-) Transcript_22021:118-675(-)|eukprot:Cvel_8105.t1-p1 / transcript=Cvel_8105.t1 / gene=Cvel_8105 / organism=Chromera_velia_CCMP2878 / gene_product=Gamma-glutamylaminecyclotransferase, putative / transcript_product=Gamma-glutamylaminecyclotransferase, putative / location=Cvel_scaffold441:469-2077(-) / protein_length=185 / sequence_SO=supercontig / SO=protein_coding / is_pseudo=false
MSAGVSAASVASKRFLVFVYGTLKTGQPNHHVMKRLGAVKLGDAQTERRHRLVVGGPYNIPYMFPPLHEGDNGSGGEQRVDGEVYEVDANAIDFLDEFESAPVMYERKQIALQSVPAPLPKETVIEGYVLNPSFHLFKELQQLEPISSYADKGEYIPPDSRPVHATKARSASGNGLPDFAAVKGS